MLTLLSQARFWTLKDEIGIKNTDFGSFRYEMRLGMTVWPAILVCCELLWSHFVKIRRTDSMPSWQNMNPNYIKLVLGIKHSK